MNSFRFIERGIHAEIARQERDRCAAGERGRAGDAALRPAHRGDHVAALQGGGARLPLLPRARPRPGRDHRGDARRAPRAALPELPAARERALRARPRPERRQRAAARLARRARRLLRGRARRGQRRRGRSRWPTGSTSSSRASTTRTRPSRRSRPAALAKLVGLVTRQEGHAGRAPSRCSTGSSPRAATRRRSSRPRAWRDRRRRRARRRSSQAALDANPDVAEKLRGGDMKPIGVDHRPRHAGDARAAPTAARSRASCARSSAL